MEAVERWRRAGLLGEAQARRLEEIESGQVFSLQRELRGLLYLGVVLLIAGVGATVSRHFAELGEPAILAFLILGVAGSWGWCFRRAAPYAPGKVSQPSAALDYLLYFGCALLGVLFTYVEQRHHLLGDLWSLYLLASAALFAAFAYRFDNRLVLSLALLDAGTGWAVFMDRFASQAVFPWQPRVLLFGAACVASALAAERSGVKPHFRETYLTVGVNALFWSVLPGALERGLADVGLYAVLGLSAAAIAYARRTRRFEYFLYGAGYGYLAAARAISGVLPDNVALQLLFFVASAGGLVAVLLSGRRSFLQEVR